jgi:hypothetical protein
VITLEDWALIRRLAAEGVPKAKIARRLGVARNTVVAAVASGGPPKYERKAGPTSFTPYEARVRQLLADTPDMPATVLAERVGWTGSIRWFRDNVNRVRAEHRPIDPADRLTWTVGDVAQCDLRAPSVGSELGRGRRRSRFYEQRLVAAVPMLEPIPPQAQPELISSLAERLEPQTREDVAKRPHHSGSESLTATVHSHLE